MFDKSRMIKELEAELEALKREAEEEEQTGIFDVKAERVDNKSNKAQAMGLEEQMFEVEGARVIQICREKVIKTKLAEVEERERSDDIEGEEHRRFLGEKLRKAKESRAKHDVEVREMETKTEKALEELRVDLVRFFPE